ncbi:MAG TPA: CAP domain-containing protein [Labilithrix sp.]|jgi:hypothetical protein|nr:CAP domain-containing protein [Labilithrix sp.]
MRIASRLAACAVHVWLLLTSCTDDTDASSSSSGSSSAVRGSDASAAESSNGSSEGGDRTDNELCWQTINSYRKGEGLPLYERWTSVEECSNGEAKSDSETGKAHGSFPRCGESAQGECPGWKGPPEKAIPQCLAAMWAEGPGGGHHDAMASTKYTKAGCGVFVTAKGAVWVVLNYQ